MLACFSPAKKCLIDENISEGKIFTAPNAMAHSITITNKAMSTGKKNLFCLNTRIQKFHEFKNILSATWTEVNKIMFLKTNDPFIFSCIG